MQYKYLVLHGRKPVFEALKENLDIACIHLSSKANGDIINQIRTVASAKGVKVEVTSNERISAFSMGRAARDCTKRPKIN